MAGQRDLAIAAGRAAAGASEDSIAPYGQRSLPQMQLYDRFSDE
jgi:hypothetical protein